MGRTAGLGTKRGAMMILGGAKPAGAAAANAGSAKLAKETSTHRVSLGRKCPNMAQTSLLNLP
jgi:hypothetical protein